MPPPLRRYDDFRDDGAFAFIQRRLPPLMLLPQDDTPCCRLPVADAAALFDLCHD